MEDMVLADLLPGIRLQLPVRRPYEERYLDLLLRGDEHGNPVHVEVALTEGLPVVGDEDQAAAPGHIAKDLDYRVDQIVRINDGVVVGVHQLPGVGFRHLHGGTYGLEHLEPAGYFL